MKSLALLGLAGLAAAHPSPSAHNAELGKRGIDLSRFRMPDVSSYTTSQATKSNKIAMAVEKRGDYVSTAKEFVKKSVPGAQFRVVDDHFVSSSGVAHINLKQTVHGIDIDNADFKVNIKNGKVFSFGNNFFTGKIPKESPLVSRAFSDPVAALKGAIDVLGLPVQAGSASAQAKDGSKEHYSFKSTSGAVSDPEARLVYFRKADNSLALTWRVETDVSDNWLLTYVDTQDNKHVHGVVDYVSDITMKVFPWDVNDPSEGGQVVVTNPWNQATSPFTWFSDGQQNYTVTRGNNGIAQNNPSGGNSYLYNYRPSAPDGKFEYTWSATADPKTKPNLDASITQLFYTANKYHDLLYTLGFTEAAGNFQTNNNNKGGRGNDMVILNAQDGSGTNNANFATPPDGQNGRMRMYLWTQSTPNRDCAFDAGVILHEYTHGLSTRLTGGPANSNCLNTLEAGGMGEGWSDFMAVAVHTHKSDSRTTDVPFGHWIYNNPKGIRQYPYSTNLKTNPMTYGTTNSQNEVHAIGTVWASILYEYLWNLIDKYGNTDADFPTFDSNGVPTDGKYLAMKLVTDSFSLQPCSPTMPQSRDAILDADKALTGGANKCEIWKAMAKRGLGVKARYGSPRTEDFTVPADC